MSQTVAKDAVPLVGLAVVLVALVAGKVLLTALVVQQALNLLPEQVVGAPAGAVVLVVEKLDLSPAGAFTNRRLGDQRVAGERGIKSQPVRSSVHIVWLRMRRKIQAARTERLALTFTAACSVALSRGVIAALVYLLVAMVPLVAVRPAFIQSPSAGAGVRL